MWKIHKFKNFVNYSWIIHELFTSINHWFSDDFTWDENVWKLRLEDDPKKQYHILSRCKIQKKKIYLMAEYDWFDFI